MDQSIEKASNPEKTDLRDKPESGHLDVVFFQKQLSHLSTLLMIGRITPELIHDINNLLTGILGYTELLSMKKIEDESIKNGLKNIYLSAERCKVLIGNLLSLSRQEKSITSLEDVNEIIEKIIELRSCALRHKKIGFFKDLGNDIPVLSVDSNKIQKAILNLIFNAEEALEQRPDGRKLFFNTIYDSPTNTIVIKITDNGLGISSDRLAQIFEPCFSNKAADLGSGIGLTEARQWIGDLGGTIEVETVEGKGSSFVIHLPVKK